MATIKGTNRNDALTGTATSDKISGLGGNDVLNGLAGNDLLDGGGGDDRLIGGAGSDTLDGALGIDTADYSGWLGSIRFQASGYATDTNGKGSVEERSADGSLVSTDQLSGVENVVGGSGNDYLYAGGANNGLWGGGGDDWIVGGDGDDHLYGGDGDDLVDVGNGWEVIDGGAGIDTIFWAAGSPSRVVVDLAAGTITYPGYQGADLISGMENVRGHWGTKEIYGSDVANVLVGGDGSDILDGRGGDDVLAGDWGRLFGSGYSTSATLNDTIRGGDGNDLISGDYGANVLSGGAGIDVFVVDVCATATTITDFEDGVDKLALYSGLAILGWEDRDNDGDGTIDAQLAVLSSGRTILFEGSAAPPASLVDGSGIAAHSASFSIPELTEWSAVAGSAYGSTTAADIYAAAYTGDPNFQQEAGLALLGAAPGTGFETF